jgi:phosphoribosylformylglycinamidine synthase II
MISRIYVWPKGEDSRANMAVKSWNGLGLKGAVSKVSIKDSYLINADLAQAELEKSAKLLTNERLENYSLNSLPDLSGFSYVVEIGFAPGVTDNVAHTVMEEIADSLTRPFKNKEAVYTSKVFLINGTVNEADVNKIALSLHNPLIERSTVVKINKSNTNLSLYIPEVILPKKDAVINVKLQNLSDEALIKIGKEGILDGDGTRRGPLALDLLSMKAIQKFFKDLKRDPTDIELESLAQTWSEHCKHTIFANQIDDIKDGLYKTYIKGATNIIRKAKGKKDFCISVFSDNAGGIIFDDKWMVTHKVETHNSPSALDPFGGAITGIVGVNRDTIGFGLGAKPIANVYGFCFGYPKDTRPLFKDKNLKNQMLLPKRIMDGVIKGINAGGNCSGIPTISGFLKFDDRYRGKPLVFAGTVGLIPRKVHGVLAHEKEAKAGDYIVVVGGKVGLDGVHGATFSSVVLDSASPATAVQIGDPITQKKLSDAIVKEARDMNLYNSITDNGAGGISCSVAEMAKECGGAVVDIEKVPLKYSGMSPWQIWISESQERMTLAVPKEKWDAFKKLMDKRGVLAVNIGEFTKSGKCVVKNNGKVIMDMPMEFLHNGLPMRQLHTKFIEEKFAEPKLPKSKSRDKELITLIGSANIGSTKFVSEQYDHEVQAGSVLKPLSGRGNINTEAQVIRPVLTSEKGVVLSSALFPSYSDINTYDMSASAIDAAVRSAVSAGATLDELAILDNTCWCSSYDEHRLAQLTDAMRACYDTAVAYGTPFISGKDSMFNDFKGYDEKGNSVAISIPPTLLISAISVMKDFKKSVSPEFKMAGDAIYVLGGTHDELGASEYYKMLGRENNAIGNNVPKVNTKVNLITYKALENAISKELIASSVSVSSGGLAVALAKAGIGGMVGINVDVKNIAGIATNIDAKLFSESQGRIVVSVAKQNVKAFEKLMKNVAFSKIGSVTKDKNFIIKNGKDKVVNTKVDALAKAYTSYSDKQ